VHRRTNTRARGSGYGESNECTFEESHIGSPDIHTIGKPVSIIDIPDCFPSSDIRSNTTGPDVQFDCGSCRVRYAAFIRWVL
jgi:hypothetical protein